MRGGLKIKFPLTFAFLCVIMVLLVGDGGFLLTRTWALSRISEESLTAFSDRHPKDALNFGEVMKICKDGRIWGQNNKAAGEHLGVLKQTYKKPKKGYNLNSAFKKGHKPYSIASQFKKGHIPWHKGKKFPRTKEWQGKLNESRRGCHHSLESRLKRSKSFMGEKNPKW
jgi:hypothetical protein